MSHVDMSMLSFGLALSAVLGRGGNGSSLLLELREPWPASLGRLSITAARAVRASPNATSTVEFAASSLEWEQLRDAGAHVTVLHGNVSDFYARRAAEDELVERRLAERRGPATSDGGAEVDLKGSMGGYFTNAEVEKEMERLAALYPHWVSPAVQIGTSRRGVKISMWCVTEGMPTHLRHTIARRGDPHVPPHLRRALHMQSRRAPNR